MKKKCPDKIFIPAPVQDDTCACSECAYMKMNTLEKLYNCLLYELPEVNLSEEIIARGRKPIDRMLELGWSMISDVLVIGSGISGITFYAGHTYY